MSRVSHNRGKTIRRAVLSGLLLFLGGYFSLQPASAAINKQLNFQGRLTDAIGNVVADGTYNLDLKLHDHATNTGGGQGACSGSCLWREDRTGGAKVTVSRGLFSIQLGEVQSLASFNFNQDLYLSIRVGGNGSPSWDSEMTPRHRLGAAPTAIHADNASTADTATNSTQLGGVGASTYARKDQANDFTQSQTISNNGGKTTLSLTSTGTDTGLTIGGDTNLYRSVANTLKTDDILLSGTYIAAQAGTANQVYLGATAAGTPGAGILFGLGASQDTNLYRSAADTLKTDDAFVVGTLGSGGTTALCSNAGQIATCSGAGANTLQGAYDGGNILTTGDARDIDITLANTTTDSNFTIDIATSSISEFQIEANGTDVLQIGSAGQLQLDVQGNTGGLLIGGDTNLYRNSSTQLRSDDNLIVGSDSGDQAFIGDVGWGGSTYVGFSHANNATTTKFALLQNFAGTQTLVNAATGGFVGLRINNSDHVQVASTGTDILTNGGKTTLELSSTGTDTGLTIGGDTNLYRSAANSLKTDDLFRSASAIVANDGSATNVILGLSGGANIVLQDTNLYRSAADTLKTDDSLIVDLGLTVNGNTTLGNAASDLVTMNGQVVGAGAATGTTGTTEATARTNVTTVTLTAAGAFANNDVIRLNNAGQDYYTRIVSGGGTTTLTVSPAVSYDVSTPVTKYTIQNIGATSTDYATEANRFFQGYFLGGVVTGAGSTTLSDGNLASTNRLNFTATDYLFQNSANSTTAFQIQNAVGTSNLFVADTTNSRIGIGTASPSVKLQVHEASTADVYAKLTNSTSGAGVAEGVQLGLLSGINGELWNSENGYLRFGTNNAERVRIDAAGDFGIGDTDPSTRLSLGGTGAANGITLGDDAADAVNLYRASANELQTDDQFSAAQQIDAPIYAALPASAGSTAFYSYTGGDIRYWLRGDGMQEWGGAGGTADTNLYRYGANVLGTGGSIRSTISNGLTLVNSSYVAANHQFLASAVSGDSFYRFDLRNHGTMLWGDGASAADTNLYRSAADTLKTDDSLIVDANLTVNGNSTLGNAATDTVTMNGQVVGAGAATGTTGTTEATARTNVTTVTLTAAGSFADNDVIRLNNAGQDYYTRIVSGGGTTTLTVSPAVSYDVSTPVTKYTIQNIGATTTDYATEANRFFQGYFLGGVVTGAGSTTLSDGNLSSTNRLNFTATDYLFKNSANSTSAFQIQNAAGTSNLFVADTTNTRIGIGASPATSLLTLGTNTTTAAGGLTFGTDTNLYRNAADSLYTDDSLSVGGSLGVTGQIYGISLVRANGNTANEVLLGWSGTALSPMITFGNAQDTNLYRSAANTLATDDYFNAGSALRVQGSSAPASGSGLELQYGSPGAGAAGGIVFGYDRTAPGTKDLYLQHPGGNVGIGITTTPTALLSLKSGTTAAEGIAFGTDTNLYRSAANTLKTDDTLAVGGNVTIDSTSVNALTFNSTRGDASVTSLQTFVVGDSNARLLTQAGGQLIWGPGNAAGDTNLYRNAASELKTDDTFSAAAYKVGATAGSSVTCSGGQFLQNQVVNGGIVTGGSCAAAGGTSTLQQAYDAGNTVSTSASTSRAISFTLADNTAGADSDFNITIGNNSAGGVEIERADGAGTADPTQMLLIDNLDTNRAVASGITLRAAAGGLTTALNASDAEIGTALAIGSNDITTTATTISSTELDRLDGKDAALVDANDSLTSTFGTIDTGDSITGTTLKTTNAGTTPSLSLQSGSLSNGFSKAQIAFGYNGTDDYRHRINTRHDSTGVAQNAMDFYLWDQASDASNAVGTKHILTLEANGRVGLNGTTAPTAALSLAAGTTAAAGIAFGTDTNLFRNAANTLLTEDNFEVQLGVQINKDNTSKLYFGSAADTNLYRSAADTLKTDDNFVIGTADSTGLTLTLDTKNTSGDPTGTDGAMYYNSSTGSFRCYAGSWKDCNDSVLDRVTSVLDVVNDNTEQTLYTFSVPGNTLGTNRALKFNLLGDLYNASGSGQTARVRVKYGATTLFDDVSTAFVSGGGRRDLNLNITLLNQGATNAQYMMGQMQLGGAGTPTAGRGDIGQTTFGANTATGYWAAILGGSATEDSTAAKTFSVTVQLGTANANWSVRRQTATLDLQ